MDISEHHQDRKKFSISPRGKKRKKAKQTKQQASGKDDDTQSSLLSSLCPVYRIKLIKKPERGGQSNLACDSTFTLKQTNQTAELIRRK